MSSASGAASSLNAQALDTAPAGCRVEDSRVNVSSRRRRALSLRQWSTRRRRATVISQR